MLVRVGVYCVNVFELLVDRATCVTRIVSKSSACLRQTDGQHASKYAVDSLVDSAPEGTRMLSEPTTRKVCNISRPDTNTGTLV